MDYKGKLPSEGVPFFRKEVCKMVGFHKLNYKKGYEKLSFRF